MTKQSVSEQRLKSALYYAYKGVQLGRLCCGDPTVFIELLIEHGITEAVAEQVTGTLIDAGIDNATDAFNHVRTVHCGNCGQAGHNRRTCRGWALEIVFGRD